MEGQGFELPDFGDDFQPPEFPADFDFPDFGDFQANDFFDAEGNFAAPDPFELPSDFEWPDVDMEFLDNFGGHWDSREDQILHND